MMRVPDNADRFLQPGEQVAAGTRRRESVVCFEQQLGTPAALLSLLLPPRDRLGRLIKIRFGQWLPPGAAAKSTDILRTPGIGPLAKRHHVSSGLSVVADEFEGRTCDTEPELMLRQQSSCPQWRPSLVRSPLG